MAGPWTNKQEGTALGWPSYVLILPGHIPPTSKRHLITTEGKPSPRKITSFRWRFKCPRVNAPFPPFVSATNQGEGGGGGTSSRFRLTESPTVKLQIGAWLSRLLNLRGEHVSQFFVRLHRHRLFVLRTTFRLRETLGTTRIDQPLAAIILFSLWTVCVLKNKRESRFDLKYLLPLLDWTNQSELHSPVNESKIVNLEIT